MSNSTRYKLRERPLLHQSEEPTKQVKRARRTKRSAPKDIIDLIQDSDAQVVGKFNNQYSGDPTGDLSRDSDLKDVDEEAVDGGKSMSTEPFRFLHLPAELGNHVYRYLVTESAEVGVEIALGTLCIDAGAEGQNDNVFQPAHPVFSVCRQIRSEAKNIFHTTNKFTVAISYDDNGRLDFPSPRHLKPNSEVDISLITQLELTICLDSYVYPEVIDWTWLVDMTSLRSLRVRFEDIRIIFPMGTEKEIVMLRWHLFTIILGCPKSAIYSWVSGNNLQNGLPLEYIPPVWSRRSYKRTQCVPETVLQGLARPMKHLKGTYAAQEEGRPYRAYYCDSICESLTGNHGQNLTYLRDSTTVPSSYRTAYDTRNNKTLCIAGLEVCPAHPMRQISPFESLGLA